MYDYFSTRLVLKVSRNSPHKSIFGNIEISFLSGKRNTLAKGKFTIKMQQHLSENGWRSETASRRAKLSEIWDSGVVVTCIWSTF